MSWQTPKEIKSHNPQQYIPSQHSGFQQQYFQYPQFQYSQYPNAKQYGSYRYFYKFQHKNPDGVSVNIIVCVQSDKVQKTPMYQSNITPKDNKAE